MFAALQSILPSPIYAAVSAENEYVICISVAEFWTRTHAYI